MTRKLMKLITIAGSRVRYRTGVTAALAGGLFCVAGLTALAQVPTISPEALAAHATITAYNGPATCVA